MLGVPLNRSLAAAVLLVAVGVGLLVAGGSGVVRLALGLRALGVASLVGAILVVPRGEGRAPSVRWGSTWLVAVIVAGAAVRVVYAATDSMHYD